MLGDGDDDSSVITVLEQLRLTADVTGVAVLDLSHDAVETPVTYSLGNAGDSITGWGHALLIASPTRPSHTLTPDARPLLACPWVLPPARPGGLLLWRHAGATPWSASDHDLAAAIGMLLRMSIGATAGQVGIDRLTG